MAIGLMSAKASKSNRTKVEDIVEVEPFPDKTWLQVRIMPEDNWLVHANHWIPTTRKQGGETSFPVACLGFNPETEELDKSKCPWCQLEGSELAKKAAMIRKSYYMEAIIRSRQERAPRDWGNLSAEEQNTGLKDSKDSTAYTPIRILRVSPTVVDKFKEISGLNTRKMKDGSRKVFPINHAKYGMDVSIRYDKDAPGTSKYNVQRGDSAPLSQEEVEYLRWNLGNPELQSQCTSVEEALADIERLGYASKVEEAPMDSKRRRRALESDDDLDLNMDAPKVRRQVDDEDAPPRKARRVEPEDEDLEPPPRKARRAEPEDDEDAPPRKARRAEPEDDEDAPPPRKARRADPEDDEDAPPRKARRAEPEPEVSAKRRRPPVDEDPDLDDLDEEAPWDNNGGRRK